MSLLLFITRSDETDSVSRYSGKKPNNVWSDLKHVRVHDHGVVQWSTALEEVRKF